MKPQPNPALDKEDAAMLRQRLYAIWERVSDDDVQYLIHEADGHDLAQHLHEIRCIADGSVGFLLHDDEEDDA